MPIPESLKTKYSLSGDCYNAENADRAISDLVACISRIHGENTALAAKVKNSEQHANELEIKTKILEDENARLDISVHELASANRRLTVEAERLDKKLADVSIAVTANDKKLSDAAERLAALTERAEQLCADLAERSDEICRKFDRRVALLTISGNVSSNITESSDINDFDDSLDDVSDKTETQLESKSICVTVEEENNDIADELFELDLLTDTDELSIDDDPNVYAEDTADVKPAETTCENTTIDTSFPNIADTPDTAVNVDGGDILKALHEAVETTLPIVEETYAAPESHTAENTNIEQNSVDKKNFPDSQAFDIPSPTDDDIKNMLAAMYADSEPATEYAAETSQSGDDTHDGDSNKNSDFGSVKSTLAAIRRKIGNKSIENGK